MALPPSSVSLQLSAGGAGFPSVSVSDLNWLKEVLLASAGWAGSSFHKMGMPAQKQGAEVLCAGIGNSSTFGCCRKLGHMGVLDR